jgi:hypothetical protein
MHPGEQGGAGLGLNILIRERVTQLAESPDHAVIPVLPSCPKVFQALLESSIFGVDQQAENVKGAPQETTTQLSADQQACADLGLGGKKGGDASEGVVVRQAQGCEVRPWPKQSQAFGGVGTVGMERMAVQVNHG